MQPATREIIFDIDHQTALGVDTLQRLEVASRYLGEFNQITSRSNLFEFDFIIEALKNIEALNSARIEGTTGNLRDLYLKEALDYEAKKRLKLFSAINYRVTINELEKIISDYKKLDVKLIRHLHKILTENDPATTGTPGKFREKEVKIHNTQLGDFYPATHVKIPELMDEFVAAGGSGSLPKLVEVALIHYQFEAIHPFEDGNGRAGRLLITAKLILDEVINEPVLNLSQYFESHRSDYVEMLRSVSDQKSYKDWVDFFLTGIAEQSKHNLEIIERMRGIKNGNEAQLRETFKGGSTASHVLRYALNNLFITIPQVKEYLDRLRLPLEDTYQTARVNVVRLVEMGILEKTTFKIQRAPVYVHAELRNMLMKREQRSDEKS